MHLDSIQNLFIKELNDLHSAEKMVADTLPKMVQAASSPEVRKAFQNHLEVTRRQMDRLEQIFNRIGTRPDPNLVCKGMEGIIREGEEVINETNVDPRVKDVALVGAAQRVEHYEISVYGTARTYAKELGYNEVVDMLQQTLDEENRADKTLTTITEGGLFKTGITGEAPKF